LNRHCKPFSLSFLEQKRRLRAALLLFFIKNWPPSTILKWVFVLENRSQHLNIRQTGEFEGLGIVQASTG
jgi:hypothetical protein